MATLVAVFLPDLSEQHKQTTENQSLISVSVSLMKELYDYADDDIREQIESELPHLFPRPTFRVGDRIKQYVNDEAIRNLLIVGPSSESATGYKRIVLVDLANGQIKQETTAVNDLDNITEKEILEAGKAFGITRSNYAKHE